MEQQILIETTESLDITTDSQPLVSISEPVQTELLSLDSQVEVKEVHEESAVLLVLTEGGSLYKKAVGEGYSGTELEWLTEVLDSKASVNFVVTTMADGYQAYAALLVDLEARVGDTYASNTKLSEVIAQRDIARALEYQNLTAKIDSDIQATNTSLMDVIVTRDMALSQTISTLTAEFDSTEARISNTEQAISTETEARALAVSSLSTTFQDRITSEISLVNTTISNANSSTATQIANLSTSFNGLLSSNITTVNESISTETAARATQIEVLRTDFTNGISAVMEQIQEVRIDIDGNTSAIDSLTSTVTNPTSGLSATFTRANQAWTLANNTAGAFSILEGKVNHATTGLAATYAFAQQVLIDANDNTASAINSLRNEITAPNAGWTANNTFIQSIKNTADGTVTTTTSLQNQITSINNNLNGNIDTRIANNTLILDIVQDVEGNTTAISGLNTSISNINGDITDLENWKTSTATVQLTAHTNRLGDLEAKAFIGVSNTVGGKATISGLTINSVDYSLRFQGDIFELTNTAGTRQLYFNTTSQQWEFSGGLVASSFKTATSGYRVEMDGTSAYPLWFGTGTKNDANAVFFLDTAGGVKLTNAQLQGGLVTDLGAGSTRGEYKDDGTYLIWLGTGTKTDVNGTFWVKKNGTGYIKGEFFQGQLMRRRNNKASLASVTVTDHITAGKPVRIDCTGYFRYQFTSASEVSSNAGTIAWAVKRNGVVIESGTRQMNRAKIDPGGEAGIPWQNIDYVQMTVMVFDNSPGTAGQNNSYTFEMTDYGYGTYSTTIATDENLVG